MRETALRFITRAGPEIGVASTKAFTTQLTALFLLTLLLAKVLIRHGPHGQTRTRLHAHQHTKCFQYNTRRVSDLGRDWSS